MPKLVVVVALWRRPALAEAMLRHTLSVLPPGAQIVAVRSPEDPAPAPIVSGVTYCEAPNRPLGRKWNAGLAVARTLDPDAVMILGSDDFASASVFRSAVLAVPHVADTWGLLGCYVWRAADERALMWHGYPAGTPRHGETIGSARAFSRAVLDRADWKLWPDDADRGLDAACKRRLSVDPDRARVASLFSDLALIDVKSDPDTDIGSLESMVENANGVTTDEVFRQFPPALLPTLRDALDPARTMPRMWAPDAATVPTISAVMMVRDEAWHLPRCLRSLRGVVDEVTVAVDARTTDRTREIARAAGCRVFDVEWQGFGPTRTESLRLARGEWALVIDADEVLADGGNLRAFARAAPPEVDGGLVAMRIGSTTGQIVVSHQVRLMRRDRASYTKRRHNRLRGIVAPKMTTATIATTYQHRTSVSLEAAITDLVADFHDEPTDAQTAFHVGHSYLGLGNFAAAAQWARRAVEIAPDSQAGAAAWLDLISCRGVLEGGEAADEEATLCLTRHPGLADAWRHRVSYALLRLAQTTMDRGRYATVPQGTLPEHALAIPAVVDVLGLPLRIEFTDHAPPPDGPGR